jgi:hypothetical protein
MVAYAQINVDPMEIVFDTTLVGAFAEAVITITNTGDADLDVSGITSSNAVFTADITSAFLAPGMSEEVTVTFAPDEVMWFEGILTLESNDPQNPAMEIELSGYGETTIGINSIDASVVSVYPNPANDFIYLSNVKNSEVFIYSLSGELMIQEKTNGLNDARISLSELNSGSYIVRIVTEHGESIVKKLEIMK